MENGSFNPENLLDDWPLEYYSIIDPEKRKELLLAAIEKGIDPARDPMRLKLFEKRYRLDPKTSTYIDTFTQAWLMMKISFAGGVGRFQLKRKKKEFQKFLEQLCLVGYPKETEAEKQVLNDELRAFAKSYCRSCASDRIYGSLFGLFRLNGEDVAKKLAGEIYMLTKKLPAQLGLEEEFKKLNGIFIEAFCETFEDGAKVYDDATKN